MISISFPGHMPLTSDSPLRPREVGSRLSAALRLDTGPRQYPPLLADSVRCRGAMAVPDTVVLPGDTSVTRRSYVRVGISGERLARCSALCCNRSGLRCNENLMRDSQLVVAKPTLVVAYGGTLQLSLLDRTESASPPRAEPCVRAPLSPPVAPASYFCGPRRCGTRRGSTASR